MNVASHNDEKKKLSIRTDNRSQRQKKELEQLPLREIRQVFMSRHLFFLKP